MENIKIKKFYDLKLDGIGVDEQINEFLEENDVRYVDIKCIGDDVYLIYSDTPHRKPYEKYPENKKEN